MKVIVTTRTGESIRGRRRFRLRGIALTEAELLARSKSSELEGRVLIPAANVAMVQELR